MKYFRHAFNQTISHIAKLIGSAFYGSLAIVALYMWKGEKLAMEEIPFVVTALAGPVIGVVLLFFWNLACAPYRIQKDRADEAERRLSQSEFIQREISKHVGQTGRIVDRGLIVDKVRFEPDDGYFQTATFTGNITIIPPQKMGEVWVTLVAGEGAKTVAIAGFDSILGPPFRNEKGTRHKIQILRDGDHSRMMVFPPIAPKH